MASRFVRLYNFLATTLLSSLILVVGGHYFLELHNPRLSAAKVDPHVIDIDPRAYQAMYANHPERDTIFEYARHDRTHSAKYAWLRCGETNCPLGRLTCKPFDAIRTRGSL